MASSHRRSNIRPWHNDALFIHAILPNPPLASSTKLNGLRCRLHRFSYLDNIMVQKETRYCLWYRQLWIFRRWYITSNYAISLVQDHRFRMDIESGGIYVLGFHGDFVHVDQVAHATETSSFRVIRLSKVFQRTSHAFDNAWWLSILLGNVSTFELHYHPG